MIETQTHTHTQTDCIFIYIDILKRIPEVQRGCPRRVQDVPGDPQGHPRSSSRVPWSNMEANGDACVMESSLAGAPVKTSILGVLFI